ncbi:MAG: 5-(carboxyamino)imidazole ribonucleotide mutase [Thermoplasmata archaeon]|nr:5-(carboxyamino)imidazole ribonucleotide mutase [Thermoplasmata archaeon]
MSIDVLIIMGSKSDEDVGKKATKLLKELDIPYKITVASAHRTPKWLEHLVETSEAKVFITIAGLAAALPGAVAAHTIKPVIGVPVSGKVNLDSILAIVQMPPGIPVAAVGLDRGDNAALLAAEILAVSDDNVARKLHDYRTKQEEKVKADAESFLED